MGLYYQEKYGNSLYTYVSLWDGGVYSGRGMPPCYLNELINSKEQGWHSCERLILIGRKTFPWKLFSELQM